MRSKYKIILLLIPLLFAVSACTPTPPTVDRMNGARLVEPIVFQTTKEKGFYTGALNAVPADQVVDSNKDVWGVIVPHHLLAADVIARTLKPLSHNEYEHIVILSPDHFSRGKSKITVATAPLTTTVATTQPDTIMIDELLNLPQVEVHNEIYGPEHGIGSVLPFAQVLWPGVRVTPILIRSDAKQQDVLPLITFLQKQLASNDRTLIIESSDFSHYLTPAVAAQKDQQTLNVLAGDDSEQIWKLEQPENCDSLNILYILKSLQTQQRSRITILENKNSQSYTKEPVEYTTSYITAYLSSTAISDSSHGDQFIMGGDLFTGRFHLMDMRLASFRETEAQKILNQTRGEKLLLNFEGYLSEMCDSKELLKLCMETIPTLSFLKRINVFAVSLANNHTLDGGNEAYSYTKKTLEDAGILVLEDQKINTIQVNNHPLSILTVTDIDPITKKRSHLYHEPLEKLLHELDARPGRKIVFIHWGIEYQNTPGDRENEILSQIRAHPVDLIVGAHPHVASSLTTSKDRIEFYSLGNSWFDQDREKTSGKMGEIKVFETGNLSVKELLLIR